MSSHLAVALVVLALAAPGASAIAVARNSTSAVTSAGVMHIAARQTMEVMLGPFASAGEACDYCAGSFTKEGDAPAGPIAPACVCMAYPEGAQYNMFCATPASAAGYVAEKGGCRCKPRDMEHMAETTCTPIA